MGRRSEAGQALVLIALALTVLMLAAGLGIDMGYLRYEKRRMQTAADSAAIAGAAEIKNDWSTAALNDASLNGFTDSVKGTAVNPSLVSCPDGTSNSCVQVVVSQPQPTFFMRVVGITSTPLSAKAIAKLASGPGCVYGGAGGISGPAAAIDADVHAGCAFLTSGPLTLGHQSSHIYASAVGDLTGTPVDGVSPPPQQIVPPTDPLAYLQPPNVTANCSPGELPMVLSGGSFVLSPDIYPCGIQITGFATVTFSSGPGPFGYGVYILGSPTNSTSNASPLAAPSGACTAGSGNSTIVCPALLITGNSNDVKGLGVTFYNTTGSILLCVADAETGNAGNDGTGCTDWGNVPTVKLTAPTDPTATYPGILFYQDPQDQAPAIIAGSDDGYVSQTYLEGALYFSGAALNIYDLSDNGLNYQNTYTILDANTVNFYGTVNLGSDYSTLPNGTSPVKDAVLVQ